jgi:hypothetical protein
MIAYHMGHRPQNDRKKMKSNTNLRPVVLASKFIKRSTIGTPEQRVSPEVQSNQSALKGLTVTPNQLIPILG